MTLKLVRLYAYSIVVIICPLHRRFTLISFSCSHTNLSRSELCSHRLLIFGMWMHHLKTMCHVSSYSSSIYDLDLWIQSRIIQCIIDILSICDLFLKLFCTKTANMNMFDSSDIGKIAIPILVNFMEDSIALSDFIIKNNYLHKL